jgi:hypothetical protein
MPPGLGGQSAIPPIYYNPATYAPAGAPVGKGVTQTNANTVNAGAIPSLPMARGGAVRFADGGSVDEYSGQPIDDMGGYGPETGNVRAAAPMAAPQTAPPPQADPYATATNPNDVHPDLPSWTPQVKDADGNPSKGVIGAIAGGLHYLASQLGLNSDGQQGAIASDPNTQQNRRSFALGQGVPGAPMPDREDVQQIHQGLDPGGRLNSGLRTLAGMEAVRNYYLTQGEPAKADQMAASMMQYSVTLSRQHGDEAVKRYYNGDLHGAVNELNRASDAVGDGTNFKARVSEDGKSVEVSNTDLNGREVWSKKDVSPQAILGAAIHARDGSLAWHMYEAQAAKYDPVTQQMIHDRNQNRTWEHQQEVIGQREDAKTAAAEKKQRDIEAAEDAAAAKFGGGAAPSVTPVGKPTTPALPGPPTAPTVVASNAPVTTSEPPVKPTDTTTAQDHAPPSSADVGYQPSPLPGAATTAGVTLPALPGPPTRVTDVASPDVPTPDAQNAELDRQEQAGFARIHQANYTPEGYPLVAGQPLPPPDRSQVKTRQDQAAYNNAFKEYQDASRHAAQMEAAQKADLSAGINSKRAAETERFKTGAADVAATRQSQRDAILNQQKDALDKSNAVFRTNLAGSAPRNDQEMNSLAGEGKTYDPVAQVARAFNPDLPEDIDRTAAMNDLKQKGFDANTQGVLANAWKEGVHHSRNTDPMEIGPAIQSFITGGPFTATAESTGPDGRPMPQHGVVRYAVTVEDNTGNHISLLLPQNDLMNLRNLRYQYARQQHETLATNVHTQGLPSLLGMPGYGSSGASPPPNVLLPAENPSVMGP